MASTWFITIGSVNVTDEAHYAHRSVAKGSLSVSQSLGGRRAGMLTVNSPDGSYSVEPGAPISITRKGLKLYGGTVFARDPLVRPGTPLVREDLTLVDHNFIADRRRCGERTWRDRTAGEIVADILAYDLDAEGINGDFIASDTLIKGEYKLVGFPSVSDVLNDLAQRAEAVWYIDENLNLRFFDADVAGYDAPFEVTGDNVTALKVSRSLEDYANKVKLNLRQFLMPEASERFDKDHGSYPVDGTRQVFAVPYPIASAPVVKVNGVKVDLGQVGVDADAAKPWFWSPGSQFISQNNAGAPLGEGQSPITDVIEVIYIGIGQLTVDATNDAEVAARAAIESSSGFHIRVVNVEDQKSQQQADELAASILAAIDELPETATFRTNSALEPSCDLLKPGHRITVLGRQYIVRTIKLQDDPNSADPDLLWLDAEAVRGPMLQDLSGILRDLASGGNTIPVGAPVDDTAALPQTATEGDNMIPDGSFESAVWDSNTEIASRVSRVASGSQHGVAHIEITAGPESGGVYSGSIPVSEGLPLAFEGWLQRVELVTAGLAIETRFYDGAGGELAGALTKPVESGTDADWQAFTVVGPVPAGAVTAIAFAYAGGHSAGTLKVDGLTLRRYSPIAAPPPMISVSANVAQDGAGVVTVLASWVQPADLGSTTAHQISAAWFLTEEATEPDAVIPLNSPDFRLDILAGEFVFNGPETEAWVEIWGENKNGDDVFSAATKSSRYLLTPGIDLSNTAGNVQLDTADPVLTWLGDVLTITHRYAPNYPTLTRFSPTLGAYISIEYPDLVTDSVDQPYTANAEADPPDNLQQYDVTITKTQILSVTPDVEGKRTIYIHACGYDDRGRVGYKPFPLQASSATRAVVFTQAELDGIKALPDPIAPTGLVLTIDNATYPNQFVGRAGWLPGAGDLSGTAQYRLQWGITSSNIAPSTWDRDSFAPGANTTVFNTDPWPKDKDQPKFGWFRIRGEMGAKFSPWSTLAAGVLINAAADTARPAQPAYGDFLLTLVEFSKDSADAATQAYLQLAVTGTQAGDHTEARIFEGAAPPEPTDIAEFKGVIHSPGNCKFWWSRKAAGMRLFYTAVNCPAPAYRLSPAADNTWKYLDIPPILPAPAVTGYSVTASAAYKIAGVLNIDISYTFTPPATDFMELHLYREQYTDATFTTRVGPAWNAVPRQAPMVWKQSGKSLRVQCSDFVEFWKYYFVPTNWLGIENEAALVTYNATFPKNTGVDSTDIQNLGEGLAKDASGRAAATSRNNVRNANFESDSDWDFYDDGVHGAGAIVAGVGADGSRGARVAQYQAVSQIVGCAPNTWYRFSFVAARSSSLAASAYIAWFKSDGSIIGLGTPISIATNAVHQPYSIVSLSPALATRAQLVPAFIMGASTGYCDVDSVTWDGLPNPGSGQTYDGNGTFSSTLRANISNGDFEIWNADGTPKDWPSVGVTQDTAFKYSGSSSAKITRGGVTAYTLQTRQAIAGQQFQARAQVYTTSSAFVARMRFYDASGALISLPGGGTEFAKSLPSVAAWQPVVITGLAPTGTVLVQFQVYVPSGPTEYCWLDAVTVDAISPASNVITYNNNGQSTVVNFGITEALIADAAISTLKIADGSVGSTKIASAAIGTAQIGTGVIVAAHIGSLTVLDAFIKNLSVSQITGGGFLSISSALEIETAAGHAASISQLGASFDGGVVCPSISVGSAGIGSTGIGFFTGLNVGGSDGISTPDLPGWLAVKGGIITGLSIPSVFTGTVPAGKSITVDQGFITGWF